MGPHGSEADTLGESLLKYLLQPESNLPLETAAPITRLGLEQDSEYRLSNEQVKNFERQWEEGPVLPGRGSEELGLGV